MSSVDVKKTVRDRVANRPLPFEIEDPKVRMSPYVVNKLLHHFDMMKQLADKGVIKIDPIVYSFFEQLDNKFNVFFEDDENVSDSPREAA